MISGRIGRRVKRLDQLIEGAFALLSTGAQGASQSLLCSDTVGRSIAVAKTKRADS
jgi:hypothetical protein